MSVLFFDEEEAIRVLQERGYRVLKVEYPEVASVTTVKKLVEFFYYKRRQYNPSREYPYSIDYSEDSKVLSSFVKAREKVGLSRKVACQESARIIDALFKYEKNLNLEAPIISPRILTVRPFIDRVCSYLNGEVVSVREEENLSYLDEINDAYIKYFYDQDLERISLERRRIMEKLNV